MGLLDYNTSDGRFLFMLPWQGQTLVGTTDTKGPVRKSLCQNNPNWEKKGEVEIFAAPYNFSSFISLLCDRPKHPPGHQKMKSNGY